jgi:hypothetical protein
MQRGRQTAQHRQTRNKPDNIDLEDGAAMDCDDFIRRSLVAVATSWKSSSSGKPYATGTTQDRPLFARALRPRLINCDSCWMSDANPISSGS